MSYLVSLYIPVFNAEKTIGMVIEAAKKQTLEPNEIIVVNDGSIDDTSKIVKSFKNINLINLNKEKGISYCRNLAIAESKNNFIASLDHDVLPEENWLQNILESLLYNKSSYCGGKMIEKYTKNSVNKWRALRYKQNWGDKDLINPPFVFGCNTIQHKDTWKKVGGYDVQYKTNGTLSICFKISLYGGNIRLIKAEETLIRL